MFEDDYLLKSINENTHFKKIAVKNIQNSLKTSIKSLDLKVPLLWKKNINYSNLNQEKSHNEKLEETRLKNLIVKRNEILSREKNLQNITKIKQKYSIIEDKNQIVVNNKSNMSKHNSNSQSLNNSRINTNVDSRDNNKNYSERENFLKSGKNFNSSTKNPELLSSMKLNSSLSLAKGVSKASLFNINTKNFELKEKEITKTKRVSRKTTFINKLNKTKTIMKNNKSTFNLSVNKTDDSLESDEDSDKELNILKEKYKCEDDLRVFLKNHDKYHRNKLEVKKDTKEKMDESFVNQPFFKKITNKVFFRNTSVLNEIPNRVRKIANEITSTKIPHYLDFISDKSTFNFQTPKIVEKLNKIDFKGPRFSHCTSCLVRNVDYYTKLHENHSNRVIDFLIPNDFKFLIGNE